MSITLASWIWGGIGIYMALGLVFSLLYVTIGVGKSDPAVEGATVGFRLIIIPGVALFWPMLALRWIRGDSAPPEETSPHRTAANVS